MWAMTLWEFLPLHLLIVAGMACAVTLLGWMFPKQSPKERLRIRITAPLTVGGYFAGGVLGWTLNPTATYLSVANVAMYATLASQMAGFLISWWVWKYYQREIEGDEDTR